MSVGAGPKPSANTLEQGTKKRNMQTSREVGRLQRRIPLEDLAIIEARRLAGHSLREIARDYGCSKQSVKHMIDTRGLDESTARRADTNTMITYKGETRPLRAWAKRLGIPYATLRYRYVRSGWSAERSLTEPINRGAAAQRKPLQP